jgi:hypothetical protein
MSGLEFLRYFVKPEARLEIRYAISQEEYVEAARLWSTLETKQRHNSLMTSWRGVVFFFTIFAIGLIMSQGGMIVSAWMIGGMAAIWLIAFILQKWVCPRYLNKAFDEQRSGLDIRLYLGEEHIESERADGSSTGRYLWSAFVKYLESENTLVLYLNRLQFIIIPKRAISSEQQEELRSLLRTHIATK